jgi:uncharacterized protein (TIGR02246 family)
MESVITKPIRDFADAWAEGNGNKMAKCFTEDAYFVAFDGTRLKGGKAIGDWHQPALNTVLRGTKLDVQIDELRMLAPDLALVATSGGPVNGRPSSFSKLIGASYELQLVHKNANDEWKILGLQVTRRRPIHGVINALVWQVWNYAWAIFVRQS